MKQDIIITSRADVERLRLPIHPDRDHVLIRASVLSTEQRVTLERKLARISLMCGCTSGGVSAILSAAAALIWQIPQLRFDFNSILYAATTIFGALVLGGIAGKLLGIAVRRVRFESVRRHLLRMLAAE